MLISLFMNVCLYAHAVSCRQERIDLSGSVMGCMISAQPIVAEWTDANPSWRVTSWKCRPG